MAKITPSALIQDIKGNVGSVTFRGSQYGLQVYSSRRGRTSPTPAQTARRYIISRLRYEWGALDEERRRSWFILASQVRTSSGMNGQYPRRAYDLFIEMNYYKQLSQTPLWLTAPTFPLAKSIGTPHGLLQLAGLTTTYVASSVDFADWIMILQMRICFSILQQSKFTPWVTLATYHNSFGISVAVPEYYDHFPPPVLFQLYQLRFINQQDGFFPKLSEQPIKRVIS